MAPVNTSFASSSSSASASRRSSVYGRRRRTDSSNSASSSSGSRTASSSLPSSVCSSSSSGKGKTNSSAHRRKSSATDAVQAAAKRQAASSSTASQQASTSAVKLVEAFRVDARPIFEDIEYEDEVLAHMHEMEAETKVNVELMDMQPELQWYMRPYLVDFIVEIHQTFRLRPETLYLTMNIVDRYVSKRIVYKRHYQLVGCAALLIAAKFEDAKDRVPTVAELSQMCCSAYDESAFTQMEGHVLSTIQWVLGFPTPEAWLRIAAMKAREASRTQCIARFLMELSLFTRDFVGLRSSSLAPAALMLARTICDQPIDDLLASLADEDRDDVLSIARQMDNHVAENVAELSTILVKKYSFAHFANASAVVRDWYTARASMASERDAAARLATAQLLTTPGSTKEHKQMLSVAGSTAAYQSSSFSTPRRERSDDDDMSMRSRSTTPSSTSSTPSRYNDEEDDEDDDDDMPVTPLSLNSLHDPLVAAGARMPSSQSIGTIKPVSTVATSDKENSVAVDPQQQQQQHHRRSSSTVFVQQAPRPALSAHRWDCNLPVA